MTTSAMPAWESKRTAETRAVEKLLRKHFDRVDAYRFNSASIRLRVIDPRFAGLSIEKRDAMVERALKELSESTQADLLSLLTLAPKETSADSFRTFLLNGEFEHPGKSRL